nr:MAG TPA: hypothetical protein [Caudoviricetes sp.]
MVRIFNRIHKHNKRLCFFHRLVVITFYKQ